VKFNLLSLVLLMTSSCIVFALARLLGSREGAVPAYVAAVVFVFGASCVAMFASRDKPSGSLVQITEWLVSFAIVLIVISFFAAGWNYGYRS
jgi:hypothetical protein